MKKSVKRTRVIKCIEIKRWQWFKGEKKLTSEHRGGILLPLNQKNNRMVLKKRTGFKY